MTAPLRKEIKEILENYSPYGYERDYFATALEKLVKRECIKARIEDLEWLQRARPAYGTKVSERIRQLESELQSELEKEG